MSSLTRFADAARAPRTARQGQAAPRPATAVAWRGSRATPRVDPESPKPRLSVLMVAFEAGRWGSVRLAKPLQEAGFQVTAICPADNPLARTRYLDRHFPLRAVKSSARTPRVPLFTPPNQEGGGGPRRTRRTEIKGAHKETQPPVRAAGPGR